MGDREPIKLAQLNAWSDGLCSCFDDPKICCQTCCCNLCSVTSMYHKHETGEPGCNCGTGCLLWLCSGCCLAACLPINGGLSCFATGGLRRIIIDRYNLNNEGVCMSCCITYCCVPCSQCQIQREMAIRNEHCGGVCADPPPPGQLHAPPVGTTMAVGKPSEPDHVKPVSVSASATGLGKLAQEWGSGYCGCAGASDCMDVCCCGPCTLGYIGGRFNAVHEVDGAEPGKMDCPTCFGGLLCGPFMAFMLRREAIERYGIVGESMFKSFCLLAICGCLCYPCVVAQTRRQMGYAEEYPGGCCMSDAPARPAQ